MALFKHSYSGLITKGLGMPSACCGMITMGFSLFYCTIQVSPPVVSGGGGGPYPPAAIHNPARGTPRSAHINYHTPQDTRQGDRYIYITVKVGSKTFEKIYTTDNNNAERIVRVIDVITRTKSRVKVALNKIFSRDSTPDQDK